MIIQMRGVYFDKINHIHVSEKNLNPLTDFVFHTNFATKLKYNGIVTYEVMKCEKIIDSIKKFYEIYK